MMHPRVKEILDELFGCDPCSLSNALIAIPVAEYKARMTPSVSVHSCESGRDHFLEAWSFHVAGGAQIFSAETYHLRISQTIYQLTKACPAKSVDIIQFVNSDGFRLDVCFQDQDAPQSQR